VIPYDPSIAPPASIVTLGVSDIDNPNDLAALRMLIDTAADISVVPAWIIEKLAILPTAETLVAGFEEKPASALVYSVAIHVAGARLYPARVITHPAAYGLLGRNVLNSLVVHLDGPKLEFEISVAR
jgi:predicted aspartyl protease